MSALDKRNNTDADIHDLIILQIQSFFGNGSSLTTASHSTFVWDILGQVIQMKPALNFHSAHILTTC